MNCVRLTQTEVQLCPFAIFIVTLEILKVRLVVSMT
jgi:hypothetical protein